MLKELLLKKLLKSKLKGVPESEQDKIIALVTKNPELFQEIAVKIQNEMKRGTEQMAATMKVMEEYKEQIQSLMAAQESKK